MVFNMVYWKKVSKNILLLILSIIALILAVKLSVFYFPFLIAFIIATIMEPLVKCIAKHTNLQRKVSAIIALSIVSVILILLITWGIIALISESSNLLESLNEYTEKIYNWINGLDLSRIKLPEQIANGLQTSTQGFLEVVTNWIKNILNSILELITKIPSIGVCIGITLVATYFICADRLYILDQIEHHFPRSWITCIATHVKELISSLGGYLKAEAILVMVTFIQVLIGLVILKYMGMNVNYPLLAAIGIGFVDALPILGSGSVILPWAIIAFINENINLGIGLSVILIIISIVRQFLEPKVVSNKLGIHPIFTLIAMYTGFKIIGIIGLLIGPIALIIIKNIYGNIIDKGIIKSIFDKK